MINTVLSPKGGTGKSTLTANMAGLLADFGYKVLMVDADPQQTLSSHYTIKKVADFGFRRLIEEVNINDVISKTVINNLDLIYCDDPDGELENTISKAADGSFRLRNSLGLLRKDYDFIFIDTIGTKKGKYNDLGIYAADFIFTPIQPESASSREFVRGAVNSVRSKQVDGVRMGYKAAPQVGFINLFDNTIDANTVMGSVFDTAAKLEPPLPMLNTIVHRTTAFPSATTARMPIHRFEPTSSRKSGSGLDVMRELTEEILITSHSLCGLPATLPDFSIKEVSNG